MKEARSAAIGRRSSSRKEIINSGLIASALEKALEDFRAGEDRRAAAMLRSLAPHWRRSGIKSAPRPKSASR